LKGGKESIILLITLLITAGITGGGLYFFLENSNITSLDNSINKVAETPSPQAEVGSIASRISNGEKMLIGDNASGLKDLGIKALAVSDYTDAIAKLAAELKANRNDPESLIYLNNAKVGNQKSIKIAVVVPIGSNLNVAKEILRGAAQSQSEINIAGGIKGALVKLVIANDDNKPPISKPIAEELVKDASILAVVGHNNSDASLAGAPVYQAAGVVMISPTATAKNLSGFGSFIFRTSLNVRFQADSLSRYSVRTANKKNLAICTSFDSRAAISLKEEFTAAVFADGAKISGVECDLSAPDFNPARVITAMTSDGVDGLLLNPSIDNIETAIAVAKAAKGRFLLLGDSTLFTFKVLELGQRDINGMVLTVPWHPEAIANNSFPTKARQLWGGNVNWRSATTYDAMQVIITGLQQNQTRAGLQQIISSSDFSALGATGKIQFQPSGDRNNSAILIKIQQGKTSGTGYDFVPLFLNGIK